MSKFKVGDEIVVHDRKMKIHTFGGKITGIEPMSDMPIYNVQVVMRNVDNKKTGVIRNVNLLENQLTRKVEDV